jgi:hypothetical protein
MMAATVTLGFQRLSMPEIMKCPLDMGGLDGTFAGKQMACFV